jgi:hypothetical protein
VCVCGTHYIEHILHLIGTRCGNDRIRRSYCRDDTLRYTLCV